MRDISTELVAIYITADGKKFLNKENAEKFLKFMLSPVAQQYFTGQVYEYPVVDGVKVHQFLNPIGDMTIPDLSMEDLSDLEGTQAILKELGILF